MKLLGGLSPETFLNEYWQKKPFFVESALSKDDLPVTPEELAGLALDEEVESRIILKEGGAYPWELRNGPFAEDDFLQMPESKWTLLVQEVDQLLPEVGAIRDRFRFIPDWRIDDVMISYAAPEGGVGPHIDNYDVFLIQGMGQRTWHLSDRTLQEENVVEGLDVRMLDGFEGETTITASPGDLLYLPPRFAHHGIAVDDCLTYSVGFRAPSQKELVTGYLDAVLRESDPDLRFSDPDLQPADHPGELPPDALQQIRELITSAQDKLKIERWFGRYTTSLPPGRALHPLQKTPTVSKLREEIADGLELERTPGVRMTFIKEDERDAFLFAAGREFTTSLISAETVTSGEYIGNEKLSDIAEDTEALELLVQLISEGILQRTVE